MRRESHVRFCEGLGVQFPRATLLTKYRRQLTGASGSFIEIRPDPVPAEMAHVEVLYANGTRVRLFSAVTPSYVTSLVTEARR